MIRNICSGLLVASTLSLFVACGTSNGTSSSEVKRSPVRYQYVCNTDDAYRQHVFVGLNAGFSGSDANGYLSITKNGQLTGTGVLSGNITPGVQGWPSTFESWDLVTSQTGLLSVKFQPDFLSATVMYGNGNGWTLTCQHGF